MWLTAAGSSGSKGSPGPKGPAGATNVPAFVQRLGNGHIPDGVYVAPRCPTERYTGEVYLFAGSYAPPCTHVADGALLSIEQYTQLFEVTGTMYGGDGRETFALPDLRASAPGHVSYAIVLYGPCT